MALFPDNIESGNYHQVFFMVSAQIYLHWELHKYCFGAVKPKPVTATNTV